jgi:Tol biopolymer transport system component
LVTGNKEWYPLYPIWSPDGEQVAYYRFYPGEWVNNIQGPGSIELWVMDTKGGNQERVINSQDFSPVSLAQWKNNGYIFLNNHDQLFAINQVNGQIYKLIDGFGFTAFLRNLSPNGKDVIVSQVVPSANIVKAGSNPIIVPGDISGWSADGNLLAYIVQDPRSQGGLGLWVRDLRSGKIYQLITTIPDLTHGFSPDGRYYAYQTDEGIFIADLQEN